MSRLILCCDANVASGLGHFTRCYDLALGLRAHYPDWELTFLGQHSEHARSTLSRAGLGFSPAVGAEFSVRDLEALLTPSDGVLLDSYRVGPPFHDFLNQRGVRWAAFDDLGAHSYVGARLVINARARAAELFAYRSARAALGPEFMPIHPDLLRVRRERETRAVKPDAANVVIFVGGTDLYGLSFDLARIAAELFGRARVRLVVSSNEQTPELPPNVERMPLQPSLTPLFADADLLISGGGRLKYEAGFALVPNAALNQTALQAADTCVLSELGVTLDLGSADGCAKTHVSRSLERLASQQARAAMRDAQRAQFPNHENQRLLDVVREALG